MSERPSMWRVVLETQWKWTRGVALLALLLAFALPLMSLRTAVLAQQSAFTNPIGAFLTTMSSWGIGYAIGAAGLGLMTAVLCWGFDHRLRHVYTLSLPLPRWQFVLLRFAAGVIMLAIPVIGVLISAEIASHSAYIPQGLHAYPLALTTRFAFASLVAFAIFFAISAATPRTAGYILGSIALILIAQVLLISANIGVNIAARAAQMVFAAPGLLAVFGGRWSLIDV